MDEEQIADIELNDRKRKREFRRLIRRQAKKRKLTREEVVRLPRRASTSSMLWTYRSIPSFKESVWRDPDTKSMNVPFYLETSEQGTQRIINEAFFDMKSILEGYSMMGGALSAVFNCPTQDSPPHEYGRKQRRPFTAPKENVIASILMEKLAADYLNMVIHNVSKQNNTIPPQLRAKFQLTIDGIIDKYLRLNPRAPANFINAGFWRGRYIINCKDIPPSVSLKEIVDEMHLWEGLHEVSELEISELVMVSVWIPGPSEDHEIIFKRIKLQNPDLNTDLWRLYHDVYIESEEGYGQWLVLGIDQMSRKMLVLFACKAKCGFAEISFVVPPFEKDSTESDSGDSDYPTSRDSSDDGY